MKRIKKIHINIEKEKEEIKLKRRSGGKILEFKVDPSTDNFDYSMSASAKYGLYFKIFFLSRSCCLFNRNRYAKNNGIIIYHETLSKEFNGLKFIDKDGGYCKEIQDIIAEMELVYIDILTGRIEVDDENWNNE